MDGLRLAVRHVLTIAFAALALACLPAAAAASVFVANGGQSTISSFAQGADGTLTQPLAPTDDYGAANLLVENGTGGYRRLYVANTYSGTISTFFISASGQLLQVAGSPTWAGPSTDSPQNNTTSHRPAGMAVSPDGKHLYVAEGCLSNVSESSRSVLPQAPLTYVGTVTSGSIDGTSNTTSVAITPDGKYLYSANATNGEGQGIDTYSVGSGGALTQVNPEGQEFACTGGSINGNPIAGSGLLAVSPERTLAVRRRRRDRQRRLPL